jgi:predicted RNA polymerase sigma factor
MLLTHARTPARTDAAGDLVPLRDQDRSRWDRSRIAEGVALLERTLPNGHVGRYLLQASIAAVHAEADTAEGTEWVQITMLYDLLDRVAPSPAVTLNRAVAVGMAYGATAAIPTVERLLAESPAQRQHRAHAVLAHLLEEAGDPDRATYHYREAARLTGSLPEQRYLNRQIARLGRRQ